MSFFAQLLGGAVSGYAGGGLADINDREKLAAQMALLNDKQQAQMDLQRQRAEDQRALREMTLAQGGGKRGGGGGDGTNVFDLLMNADTPEKQQRAVALIDAFGGPDSAALVSDKVYGRAPMTSRSPTAGDFARFDRGDPGAEAVPQATVERAAYDRDKGQQALQRLYAMVLDPGKTDDFAKAERQFGLNDFGAAVAGNTMRGGGSLKDAATGFSQYSSPKDETEKNDIARDRIEATRERTRTTDANADENRKSAERRKLQELLVRTQGAKEDLLNPNAKTEKAAAVVRIQAQLDALDAGEIFNNAPAGNAPAGNAPTRQLPPAPFAPRKPSEAARAFKYQPGSVTAR